MLSKKSINELKLVSGYTDLELEKHLRLIKKDHPSYNGKKVYEEFVNRYKAQK